MALAALLTLWATLLVSLTSAGLIPRQTLPPGHFFIKAFSTDSTVNGKFAFIFGTGGTIFIGPVINHQGWEPIETTFNATAQTLQGGPNDIQSLWVIRDQQGATTFVTSSPSGASLNAPYSILSSGEITSLWEIPYPWGWTTCKDSGNNNLLFYQKFGPECTPVKLIRSKGPVVT